jgi:menaquinone-dependent protoporphyrinogen oxidase
VLVAPGHASRTIAWGRHEEREMKVLVTAASKHGATWEIAEAVRDGLRAAGLEVVLTAPEHVTSLEGLDAVVLGSGVYAGHWLEPARSLVARLSEQLPHRKVWLFSSGPIGDPPMPDTGPADAEKLLASTGAEEHRVFAGRLERSRLGLAERAVVAALRAPEGDFRDWDAIAAWAGEIAHVLQAEATPA